MHRQHITSKGFSALVQKSVGQQTVQGSANKHSSDTLVRPSTKASVGASKFEALNEDDNNTSNGEGLNDEFDGEENASNFDALDENESDPCPNGPVKADPPRRVCNNNNKACGLPADLFYDSRIVQQWTVIAKDVQFDRLLRNLATNCPLNPGGTRPVVNIPALMFVKLCPNKALVKFIPGHTVEAVTQFDKTVINRHPGFIANVDIQTYTELTNTSAAIGASGIPLSRISTQQVLAVATTSGTAGVYAEIVDRLYGNVEILAIYTDESGYLLIIEVRPEDISFAQSILGTKRGNLKTGIPTCYECKDLPEALIDANACRRPVLNCDVKYPCPKNCKENNECSDDDSSDDSSDDGNCSGSDASDDGSCSDEDQYGNKNGCDCENKNSNLSCNCGNKPPMLGKKHPKTNKKPPKPITTPPKTNNTPPKMRKV